MSSEPAFRYARPVTWNGSVTSRGSEASRGVLHDYGNMSSGPEMVVLDRIIREAGAPKSACKNGCAMSVAPGLVAENMMFRMAA